jgi:hypothetical protein
MVFVKNNILDPMQSILNRPLPTNDAMKLLGTGDNTADVVLALVEWLSVSIPASLHHNRALDAWPLMPKGGSAIKHTDPPGRTAPMSLFVFLIATERLLRFRLLCNASIEPLLIGFNTHQIVIALLDNVMECFFDSAVRPA